MAAARQPHLTLVDTNTGEVVEDERDILIAQLQAELAGKSLAIGKLKRDLANARAVEPRAEQIREVLSHCKQVWNSRWSVCPGGKRWAKVRDRLMDKFDDRDPFTVEELKQVPEGALLDPWLNGDDPKSKGYLKVETCYRDPEQVERLVGLARGFEVEHGIPLGAIPERVLRDFHFEPLLDVCDCGHLRLEHSKADPFREGAQPCLVHTCACEEFDDFEFRVERWRRAHQ